MVRRQYSAFLCFLFIGLVRVWALRRILLSDVEILTLRDGRLTSGRRSEPIPQLQCTNCDEFWPEEVKCYNRGKAGTNDITWRCTTELPHGLSLANPVVQCEGYDYPDDPYVLESSCGLIFEVKGRRIYRDQDSGNMNYKRRYNRGRWGKRFTEEARSSGFKSLLIFVIIGFLAYSLFCKAETTNGAPQRDNTHRYRGDGFGGGDYPDGVPYNNTWSPWGFRPSWRPSNFWTGFGAGGGLAYLFSRRRRPAYSGYSFHDSPRNYGYRSGFDSRVHSHTSNSSHSGTSSPLRSSSSTATTRRR